MITEQEIEILIERIRQLMPSTGTWPFTVMQLKRSDLASLEIEPILKAERQLIFLIRIDFERKDLIDYIMNTHEFDGIPVHRQQNFLNDHLREAEDPAAPLSWSEKIISMAIGFAFMAAQTSGLILEDVPAKLIELDRRFAYPQRSLKAYQLFEVASIEDRPQYQI